MNTQDNTLGLDQDERFGYSPSRQQIFYNLIWLTTKEAAEYLRTTANNVRVMICRGKLKPYKLGRKNLFKKSELDELIESSRQKDSYEYHV